jgi:outer membrane receptor protein involved in Fe transport
MQKERRVLTGLIAGLLSSVSFAQAYASTEAPVALEEIVVSAQKRTQSLQDVPLAVTALGENLLEKLNVDSFVDYARVANGVSFGYQGEGGGQFGQQSVFIRGISSSISLRSMTGSPVGFYVNETPLPFSNPNIFDVQRIEVLRGPQGTLYGSGSMGGTIKLVTNQPKIDEFEASFEGDVSVTKEGGENFEARGMVNVPLVEEKLALRLTAAYKDESGFIDNVGRPIICDTPGPGCELDSPISDGPEGLQDEKNHNDAQRHTFRAALRFEPTESFTMTPSIFYEKLNVGGDSTVNGIRMDTGEGDPIFGLKTNMLIPTPETNRLVVYDLTLSYDFGGAELTSSTSYTDWQSTDILDLSFLFQGILQSIFTDPDDVARAKLAEVPFNSRMTRQTFTEEIRLASTGDGPFNWLVGAFYLNEDVELGITSRSRQIANDPEFSTIIPNGLIATVSNTEDAEQVALFGEVTYDITEKLSITGGLRWFDSQLEDVRIQNGFLTGGFLQPELSPQSENGFNPKIAVNYNITDDHMVYALASKGFRTGGVVAPANNPGCGAELASYGFESSPETFDSDSLWSYEVGAKTAWAENRLIVNTSLYYLDWSQIQQNLFLQCGTTLVINAGEAVSKGAEVEFQFLATDNLSVYGNFSYNDGQLTEDNPVGVGKDGDRVLLSPKYKFAAGWEYTLADIGGYSPYIRADYQYSSAQATSFTPVVAAENNQNKDSSYHMLSMRAGVSSDEWEAAVYAKNILDKRPMFFANTQGFGTQFNQFTTFRPRTIGLMVKRNF